MHDIITQDVHNMKVIHFIVDNFRQNAERLSSGKWFSSGNIKREGLSRYYLSFEREALSFFVASEVYTYLLACLSR